MDDVAKPIVLSWVAVTAAVLGAGFLALVMNG